MSRAIRCAPGPHNAMGNAAEINNGETRARRICVKRRIGADWHDFGRRPSGSLVFELEFWGSLGEWIERESEVSVQFGKMKSCNNSGVFYKNLDMSNLFIIFSIYHEIQMMCYMMFS